MTRMRFTATAATLSTSLAGLFAAWPGLAQAATGNEPAGGAAAGEAIGATAAAVVVTALIALLIAGHRSGRVPWLDHAAKFFERQTGLPGWAALPAAVLGAALLMARARACTGTSRSTSTTGATPGRSPIPRTT